MRPETGVRRLSNKARLREFHNQGEEERGRPQRGSKIKDRQETHRGNSVFEDSLVPEATPEERRQYSERTLLLTPWSSEEGGGKALGKGVRGEIRVKKDQPGVD